MKHMRQDGVEPSMPSYQTVETLPDDVSPIVAEEPAPARKKHRIYDHKILATIWPFFGFFVLSNLISVLIVVPLELMGYEADTELLSRVIGIFTGLLMLLWFHFRFRRELKGFMGWSSEGLLLAQPALLFVVLNLMGFLEATDINPILTVLVMALTPGIAEEVIFRGVPCSNWMRVSCDEGEVLPCVLVTSLVFGVVHGANFLAGAALSSTIFQISYAFALGVFFAAVFLRCGSIWPTVIMHALIDASGFLFMDLAANGLITEELTFDWSFYATVAAALVLLVIGLYLVRPSKRAQVVRLWEDKWGKE